MILLEQISETQRKTTIKVRNLRPAGVALLHPSVETLSMNEARETGVVFFFCFYLIMYLFANDEFFLRFFT